MISKSYHAIGFMLFVFALLCTTIASAATLVFITSEEQDSKAIQSIVRGIEGSALNTRILAVNDLNASISNVDLSNDRLIVLGARLVAQSVQLPKDLLAIGGGFYEPLGRDITIPVLPLDPAIGTIATEIIKTGFTLSRLVTVTTDVRLKTFLDSSVDELNSAGVELDVRLSDTERGIARAWFEVLRDIDPKTDALLISDATFLDSSGTYKILLETAWRHNILVVSTLPQYARRGVSIGFIPDLVDYGALLVDTVERLETSSEVLSKSVGLSTRVLIRVINQRTLEYIGYTLPTDIDQLNHEDLLIE